jgi:hypothetical protein
VRLWFMLAALACFGRAAWCPVNLMSTAHPVVWPCEAQDVVDDIMMLTDYVVCCL